MMQQPRSSELPKLVLVIDSHDGRAKRLVTLLESPKFRAVRLRELKGKATFTPEPYAERDVYSLVLIHAGDAEWLVRTKLNISASKFVYYGGLGGNDIRIPPNAARVWRPMSGETVGITADEAADLLRYAETDREDYVPALLLPAPSFPLLRTLGVLTVGYMAVEAADRFGVRDAPVSGTPYERLGWGALSDSDRKRLVASPGGLLSHRDEVQAEDWWLRPLKAAAGGIDRVPEELKQELDEAQRRGFKNKECVQTLVNQLLQQKGKVPSSSVVESAFQALTRLEQW